MVRTVSFLAIALLAGAAHAEVFRCTSSSGSVSYQEMPCGADETLRVVNVPSAYPAPNVAERDRLFQREAALDQRLEMERERLSREAIVRMTQPEPQVQPPMDPQYAWLFPPVMNRSFRQRPGPHPRPQPFMR